MSKRLHDGLRINMGAYSTVFDLVDTVRQAAGGVLLEMQARELSKHAVAFIDQDELGLSQVRRGPQQTAVTYAIWRWQQKQESLGEDHPLYDPFRFWLQVLQAHSGKVLAIPYVADHEYVAALLELPGFAEYAYWDSTDRPDDVPPEEWDERAADWSSAYGVTGIPGSHGFSIELVHTQTINGPWRSNRDNFRGLVVSQQPSLRDRARVVVRTELVRRLRGTAWQAAALDEADERAAVLAGQVDPLDVVEGLEPLVEEDFVCTQPRRPGVKLHEEVLKRLVDAG